MKKVSILAVQQALVSSMAIPMEMISAAESIRRARTRQRNNRVELRLVSEQPGNISLIGGIQLISQTGLDQSPQNDLIFVPALWGNPLAALHAHPASVDWLRQQYEAGASICSVGSGSYFLARAGLLDQRMATTHWRYFDDFAKHYPAVKLQRKRFITAEDRLYCTGSVNAARDIMLHFVEQLFDSATANEVARHFTHELKRSYESELLAMDQHNTHHDEQIIKVQEWLQKHHQQQITISGLAKRFNINQRSFNRRFRLASGQTPMQYLQDIRITQARSLLKHSNLSIAETAYAVGYQDVSYFTGLFRRINTVTPGEYRRLVRNKMFTTHS